MCNFTFCSTCNKKMKNGDLVYKLTFSKQIFYLCDDCREVCEGEIKEKNEDLRKMGHSEINYKIEEEFV